MGELADALTGPLQRRLTEAGTVGQRDVAAMVNMLGEAELLSSLDEGTTAVANRAGVLVDAVVQRMPSDALLAQAAEVGRAQRHVIEAMGNNQSEWLGAFQSVAGVGIDLLLQGKVGLGGLGIGDALSKFAADKFREGQAQEALAELATRLQAFEALVEQTALQLDADAELAQALAKKNKNAMALGCAFFLVLGALLAGLVYLGWRGWRWATTEERVPASSASAHVLPPPPPPSSLVGEWVGPAGQTLTAVELGGAVELDVSLPGSWAEQGYVSGEMRFRLRALAPGADSFSVEEKVRPVLPKGVTASPEASVSCHVLRTHVGEAPLRGRLRGDRLIIESVRSIVPSAALTVRGGRVTSCAMDRAAESKVELVFERAPAAQTPRRPGK